MHIDIESRVRQRTDQTIELFNELSHIGWQASLPAEPNGFKPVYETFQTNGTIDLANQNYEALPPTYKRMYSGQTGLVTAFLNRVVMAQAPIDEATMLQGRQQVYRGQVHGKYGNPDGQYETSGKDKDKHDAVSQRYDAYDAHVPPTLQRVDENVVCLGFLALCRPEVFPWVEDHFWNRQWVDGLVGLKEAELHGMAAVKRVVRVRQSVTPLQEALLEGRDYAGPQ